MTTVITAIFCVVAVGVGATREVVVLSLDAGVASMCFGSLFSYSPELLFALVIEVKAATSAVSAAAATAEDGNGTAVT